MNKDELVNEVLTVLQAAIRDRYTYYEESTESLAMNRLEGIIVDLLFERQHPDSE